MSTLPARSPDETRQGADPLKRACMHSRIRDVLVSRILDNSYAPGFRLKELSLAREFNVSQAPVREALRELQALGLVTSEAYRGTSVRSLDLNELREAYELRALIEARAAELAVPCVDNLCDELAGHLDSMRRAIETRDRDAHAQGAVRFHRRLVEASGNRTFVTTWDSFHWDVRARLSLRRAAELGTDLMPMIALHAAVLDRLRADDAAGAAAAVRRCFEAFISILNTA